MGTWCLKYKPGKHVCFDVLCIDTYVFFNHCSIFSDDWNISSVLDREDREELLICRTNGALECFNRELNHAFPNAHPSMPEFVTTIRRISADKYTQYDRVARGRERAPVHQPVNLFTVPAAYFTFEYIAPIA